MLTVISPAKKLNETPRALPDGHEMTYPAFAADVQGIIPLVVAVRSERDFANAARQVSVAPTAAAGGRVGCSKGGERLAQNTLYLVCGDASTHYR